MSEKKKSSTGFLIDSRKYKNDIFYFSFLFIYSTTITAIPSGMAVIVAFSF